MSAFEDMSLEDLYCAVLGVKFDLVAISRNRCSKLIFSPIKSSQKLNSENKGNLILNLLRDSASHRSKAELHYIHLLFVCIGDISTYLHYMMF